MSNKTLKKRIAAVAASALTAGFLSVVAMPAANAASTAVTVTTVTGQVVAPASSGSATTLTITSTGNATFAVAAVASVVFGLNISGGTFESATAGGTINADKTQFTGTACNTAISGLVAKPTSAGRNMIITSYFGNPGVACNGTNELTALATSRTNAAVDRTITATVITPGSNAVFSSGLSAIAIMNTASTLTATSNADASFANIVNAGGYGVISYALKDGNSNNLPSTALVYASIKSGACVIGRAQTVTSGTFVVGQSPTDSIYVRQADQINTPAQTCVAEITIDGVLAATKTFTFQGPVAAITVTGLGVGATSTPNTAMGYVVATDSAGNQIGGVSVSGIILDSAKSGIVSAVSVAGSTLGRTGINVGTAPAAVPQTVGWTCGATAGTAPVVWRVSNGIGGFITSPTYNVACGGDPVTYTASLDKASYVPGDIATLTITGKDSRGLVPNDAFVISAASTGQVMSLSGSQMTLVGAIGTAEKFTNGVGTFKFVVGTTEGSYNMVVDIPLILTATNKTTYGAATQTVAYKVASGSTAVTNAEVLAAIVKLIASINKQIRALQKSLRR